MVLPRWLKGKKFLNELHMDIVNWVHNHANVFQSPIHGDVVKLPDPDNPGEKMEVGCLLLDISVQDLHNMLVDSSHGLKGVCDDTGAILVGDSTFRKILKEDMPEL